MDILKVLAPKQRSVVVLRHWEQMSTEETAAALGVQADFVVRTARQWRAVIAANPFAREAEDDPSHLLVMFFKARLAADAVAAHP